LVAFKGNPKLVSIEAKLALATIEGRPERVPTDWSRGWSARVCYDRR